MMGRRRLYNRVGHLESNPTPDASRLRLASVPRPMAPCAFDDARAMVEHVRGVFGGGRPDGVLLPGWTDRERQNWHLLHRVALKARPRHKGGITDEERPAVVAAIRACDALLAAGRFDEAEAFVEELGATPCDAT